MRMLALRGLMVRKLRVAMTGFAVIIGVAFVTATFIYSDTIDQSFKDVFQRASKGADVQVTAKNAIDDLFTAPSPFSASVLDRVRAVDGVDAVAGGVNGMATVLGDDGEPIGVAAAGPAILVTSREERFDPFTYVEGDPITSPDEIALDAKTAKREQFEVGDKVTVAGPDAAPKQYTLGAIVKLGDAESVGSAMVTMTLPEAQRITGRTGQLDEIVVAASGGTDPEALKKAVAAVVPSNLQVETGEEAADRQATTIGDQLGFITTALLVFGIVALLVGGFLIFNTFSITVAQRTREFALLRTIGASRAQVMREVLVEALFIGVVASALGVLAGLALAPGLAGLLASFGLELPNTGTVLAADSVIIGMAIGIIATLVAGIVPARKATRVDPMEALRESAAPSLQKPSRRRVITAAVISGLGMAITVIALLSGGDGGTVAGLIGLGAVVAIFGVALLAPVLVRPLARVIGRPLAGLGVPGRLARENAERQPQRTAVTASALMIGLAVVVFVSVLAAGLKASITDAVDEKVVAEVIVSHDDGFSPVPQGANRALEADPQVNAVSGVRFASARVNDSTGGRTFVSGIDPSTFAQTINLEWPEGSMATATNLRDDQIAVEDGFAEKRGVDVGDKVTLTAANGKKVTFTVAGEYKNAAGFMGDVTITNAAIERDWSIRGDSAILVDAKGPVNPKDFVESLRADLAQFGATKAQTKQEFTDAQGRQVDSLLGLIYALLALSVIVSILGIVNTLALSIYERTRELGMLRAIGTSKRQVRQMVVGESVITALIGAVLGLVLGVVFAVIISQPLASEGFVLTFPIVTLIFLAVFAAIVGVIAALLPARRAAKTDVLHAIVAE